MTGDSPPAPADADAVARLARLSTRERQVLELTLAGKRNGEIAAQLGISPRTVEVFKGRMKEKLCARSLPEMTQLVRAARTG